MSNRRIVREGYLTKSPPPDKLMAKWHERFCVLWSTQVMEYYTTKDKRAQDYCKSIDLGHCDDIIAPSPVGNRDCVIKVRMSHPRGRDYMFDCGNETNMKAWVEALSSVCKHAAEPEGHSRSLKRIPDRALPQVPTATAAESPSSEEEEDELLYEECLDESFSQSHPHPGNSRYSEAKNDMSPTPDDRRRAPVTHQSRHQQDLTPPDDSPEEQTYEELTHQQDLTPPDENPEQTYEELDDMQPLTTRRPPVKLPTKPLTSNGNIPPDTRKRPPAPPPKPQNTSCDESDQQENYEELDDMQPSGAPKQLQQQQPPLKLPIKLQPNSINSTMVALPGLDARKRLPLPPLKPQPAETDQQENYEEMIASGDVRKYPPQTEPCNAPDQEEVEEPRSMTMKKPLLNPKLKQALGAAAAIKKAPAVKPKYPPATATHRENNSSDHEEEEDKQEEVYEEMDSSTPPVPSRSIIPSHREGQGSTPRHTSNKMPKSYDKPTSPQPYEDFVSAHPYKEPIAAQPYEDHTTARKPLSDELVSSPVAKHRELKGVNGKDPMGSRDVAYAKVQQASNDDVSVKAISVQQKTAPFAPRGKCAFPPSSSTSPPTEIDTPPSVPRRVESIGQSSVDNEVDPPPPPPRRTTSAPNLEDDELSKRNKPPALPGRKSFDREEVQRSDLPALPGGKHSYPATEEESPPQSANAPVRDEHPNPPHRNTPPSKSSTQVDNATATNDRPRNLCYAQTRINTTALSNSNWMPPKDAGAQLTPQSEVYRREEPTNLKPSPVRPSLVPKPSTTCSPPIPSPKGSLCPPVQPRRPGSPGVNVMKPLPQPTPKPRTRPRSPDEKELGWRKHPTVITS